MKWCLKKKNNRQTSEKKSWCFMPKKTRVRDCSLSKEKVFRQLWKQRTWKMWVCASVSVWVKNNNVHHQCNHKNIPLQQPGYTDNSFVLKRKRKAKERKKSRREMLTNRVERHRAWKRGSGTRVAGTNRRWWIVLAARETTTTTVSISWNTQENKGTHMWPTNLFVPWISFRRAKPTCAMTAPSLPLAAEIPCPVLL